MINLFLQLLAKELFIVMLRKIHLMPEVMDMTFPERTNSVRKTSNFLLVLLNVLGLANGNEALRGDFSLSLERIDHIEHLFSYEVLDTVIQILSSRVWPSVIPNEGVFVVFFELLAYLLVRKSCVNRKFMKNCIKIHYI